MPTDEDLTLDPGCVGYANGSYSEYASMCRTNLTPRRKERAEEKQHAAGPDLRVLLPSENGVDSKL